MRRRRFVTAAGALFAAGAAGATGCLGAGDANDENVVWEHGVGGRVDAVHDGTVYGREDPREEGKRGVFALNAADGENVWTYGEVGGYSTYTDLIVADGGVYFGHADDEVGSGAGELYALDHGGEERWTHEVGSVYDAPVVRDGTVYVGSDRATAHAFDEEGEARWRREFDAPEEYATPLVGVEAVEDGVAYVTAYESLHGLDAASGDEVWSHESDRVSDVVVSDGTVYVTHAGRVAAYAEGDEVWSHEVEGTNPNIRGFAHGNVYFGQRRDLLALDAAEGDELWSEEVGEDFPVAFGDENVYTGERDVTAFAPGGSEIWTAELDGSELNGITVADGSVYAVTDEGVHEIDSGEVVSSADVPGDEDAYSHVVADDTVYIGTRGGVYALSLS